MNAEPTRSAEEELARIDLAGGGLVGRIVPSRWRGRPLAWLVAVGLTWGVPFFLSLLASTAVGDAVARPFLTDPAVHARFLVSLPLFLLAERVVGSRLNEVVDYLWNTEILAGQDRERFAVELRRFESRIDSVAVELVLALAAFVVAWLRAVDLLGAAPLSWFGDGSGSLSGMTPAGWWRAFVSQPLWLFLLMRWGYRIAAWSWFLRGAARLDLRLVPAHPDRVGGLGALQMGQVPFVLPLLGVSAILSANLAQALRTQDMTLRETVPILAVYLLVCVLVVVGPLLAFTPRLIRAKRRGLVEYGGLGDEVFRAFDEKWISRRGDARRELLGSGDPSTLADYGYAYEVVCAMRALPFSRRSLVLVLGILLVPFVPLLLIDYSPKEILQHLLGILG